MSSFFEPLDTDGVRWRPTVHATGPWDAANQHGGPPSALMARAMERVAPRDDMVVARTAVELFGPAPMAEVEVHARVVRPGRRVELLEAGLRAGGRDVARASAWRVARAQGEPVPPRVAGPPPLPPASTELQLPGGWVDGFLSAVEWRLARGSFTEPGPCAAWIRLLHPLVPDEEPTGLQRLLTAADTANGVSGELPPTWYYINPESTVHLHREPAGEWTCVDAVTTISPGGAGLATATLSDLDGPVGVSAQSLLVAPRS